MREVISEIPEGYKVTPLGIIPMDWEIKELGEISIIKGDYGINAASVEYSTVLPTYIRITDIDDDGNFQSQAKKSVDDKNFEKYILNDSDIVFARTGATVGKTYLHNKVKDGQLVFAGFLIRFRVDSNRILPFYLKSFSCTKLYWDWVKKISMRSGQPGINSQEYCALKIPLPSIAEQKLIANGLALMDSLIDKLNQIIQKKELQKKALMQQLLTGKKRLRDFTKKWEEKRLGDIFDRVTRKNTENNTNVVTISAQRGFVRQEDFFNKIIASDILDNYFLVEHGEFCYNKSYSNGYPWGATKRLNDFDKAVVTTLYICFKLSNHAENSGSFFEQYFEAGLLEKGLMKIAHEGGRAHGLLNVTPSDFFNLKITIPPIKEQTAISKVLQTADKEIKLLKAKAEKLKEQKKGMMQVLLTGKKRLKIN